MEIKSLESISLNVIHRAFVEAFSDYQESMEICFDDFSLMMEKNSLDQSLSVGAFADNNLISFILVGRREDRVYDAGTATVKEYRKKGIASDLFEYQKKLLVDAGIKEYVLECIDTNEKAKSLYEKKGFSITRHFDCYRIKELPYDFSSVSEYPIEEAEEIEASMTYKPSWQNSYQSYKGYDSYHLYGINNSRLVASDRGAIPLMRVDSIEDGITLLSYALRKSETGALRIINIDRGYEIIDRLMKKIDAERFVSQVEMKKALDLQIRKIQEDEIREAESLMLECFGLSYSSIFFLHPEHTFVAIRDNKVIGGINADVYDAKVKVGYLGWLYIDPEYRKIGISKLLLDKALDYLENVAGCQEIIGCIEGDNPSSFKTVANREGFAIMKLREEFRTFGFKTFKVWKRASRFFDMGYFLWHKSKNDRNRYSSLNPTPSTQVKELILTILLNTILFSISLLIWGRFSPLSLLIPSVVLIARTLVLKFMLSVNKTDSIFLGWDTSWTLSSISILMPIYFPSPGGIYPRGKDWTMREKSKALGRASIAAAIVEALLLLIPSTNMRLFLAPLFIADTMLFFYPFCGFGASRAKRYLKKGYPLYFILALSVIVAMSILLLG